MRWVNFLHWKCKTLGWHGGGGDDGGKNSAAEWLLITRPGDIHFEFFCQCIKNARYTIKVAGTRSADPLRKQGKRPSPFSIDLLQNKVVRQQVRQGYCQAQGWLAWNNAFFANNPSPPCPLPPPLKTFPFPAPHWSSFPFARWDAVWFMSCLSKPCLIF